MSEIRQTRMEDIGDPLTYMPNIPDNWYVPAKQAWRFFAWGVKNLQCEKRFESNEQVNHCMDTFETWVEDWAIAYGKERR